MPEGWFCVQTNARQELAAKTYIEEQGFEVFCPLYLRHRTKNGKRVKIATPLFMNYIFCRFDPAHPSWRIINVTIGVVRVLASTEETPLAVPDHIVTELQNSVGA